MTVYILGGGPAGLAVVHGLMLEGGPAFTLIERGQTLGGLAQTVSWDGHGKHDLGPHKLFTIDRDLMARVKGLLPSADWLTRDKLSSIYISGHFLPYPPSPFALGKVFGGSAFLGMTVGYGAARLKALLRRREAQTFEEDLEGRLGESLYRALFKPIASKLWGDPKELDVKLSKGRVQTPSALEVISGLLGLRRTSDFEALTFSYPRGGLQRLWDSIQSQASAKGCFLMQHEVKTIDVKNERVRAIRCLDRSSGEETGLEVGAEDFVVSSLPISLLPQMMRGTLSDRCRRQIETLIVLNDLLLVFLKLDRRQLFPESWVFVPDPNIAFHRVSEQESFDPEMTPGGSIVCCEIMSHALRPLAREPDETLVERAKTGLADMGYRDFQVKDERVIRLPKSYPVFRTGFEPALKEVLGELDRIKNFRTIGRQGTFSYIGSLDAMDIGYGFARWYTHHADHTWQEERERTSHYPVLD